MPGLRAVRYIFFETLPAFLMGVLVFVGILLMFQALRLTEFVLVHGVSLGTIGRILLYLSVSFLPVILPMSLLFAVLLTYARLSNDSEIVAFKSIGLNMFQLTLPALMLGVGATVMSAQTSFYLGPWGNRKFELLIDDLARSKVTATVREGVFSEGFFDLVVYANHVDSKKGLLTDVFIYDERDQRAPITIIAKHGTLVQEQTPLGTSALLRLNAGNIHRTHDNTYTKVDFGSYDINLFDAKDLDEKKKSPPSMTIDEVKSELATGDLDEKQRRKLEIEYARRWSLPAACLIFAILGVGLGTVTNKRAARGAGFVLCLILLISYWVLYVSAEGVARAGYLPAGVAMWLVNGLFLLAGLNTFRRSWT